MDGKYIIILLFIFLVFLMGSINSTVTNNFYNNTTGAQDHAVLSNLSYTDSNHTGFQSSDTLDSDVSALGYVTDEYHDSEKVNKSGDTMTGTLSVIESAEINLTTSKTFNFIFGNVPRMLRNSTLGYRVAPLATINLLLEVAGGIGNGGGPALIFWNRGNISEGNTEYNLGRVAVVWKNKVLNTTKIQFYAKNGVVDYGGLQPAFSAYVKESNTTTTGTESVANGTIETGDLILLNMTATGSPQPICLSSANTLIICP